MGAMTIRFLSSRVPSDVGEKRLTTRGNLGRGFADHGHQPDQTEDHD